MENEDKIPDFGFHPGKQAVFSIAIKFAEIILAVCLSFQTMLDTSCNPVLLIVAWTMTGLCTAYILLNILQFCGKLLTSGVNRIIHGIDWIVLIFIIANIFTK